MSASTTYADALKGKPGGNNSKQKPAVSRGNGSQAAGDDFPGVAKGDSSKNAPASDIGGSEGTSSDASKVVLIPMPLHLQRAIEDTSAPISEEVRLSLAENFGQLPATMLRLLPTRQWESMPKLYMEGLKVVLHVAKTHLPVADKPDTDVDTVEKDPSFANVELDAEARYILETLYDSGVRHG